MPGCDNRCDGIGDDFLSMISTAPDCYGIGWPLMTGRHARGHIDDKFSERMTGHR